MKYLLMVCGAPRHWAISPAIAAALLAMQHACHWLPVSLDHTRGYLRLVEIAHLGLVLKLASDISCGCGLHFWTTVLGESRYSNLVNTEVSTTAHGSRSRVCVTLSHGVRVCYWQRKGASQQTMPGQL